MWLLDQLRLLYCCKVIDSSRATTYLSKQADPGLARAVDGEDLPDRNERILKDAKAYNKHATFWLAVRYVCIGVIK